MRAIIVAVAIVIMATGAFALTPEEREGAFAEGNRLFTEGRFDEALRAWALIDIENPDLSRNRGAAYERLGDRGRAMLHYQRALRLDPGDQAAQAGVARIEQTREDRVALPPPSVIERGWGAVINALSLCGWAILWLTLLWLMGLGGAWLLAEPGAAWRPTARRLAVGGLAGLALVTIPFGWRVWRYETDATGVVIAGESVAAEEPDGGAKRFTLHAGMVGMLGEREGESRRFTAPNGVTGWVREETIAPVQVSP
ncbi:MAG: tetratricopeptide repeat protein [Nitrospinae bacterium]|nr:tetratricopeptide repeat protein [Nitrospinota bacterium]